MNTKGVNIKNITKIFKPANKEVLAVNNISIEIKPREFVTLLGPSGCGKTTMLRMIAGFETPTSGEIFIGEDIVNNLPANKRDSAMVFQSYALFPHYSIFENIAYGLKIKKMPKFEIEKKVNNIIELVGLKDLQDRNPAQLSGGQQQRVALARALVMEPSVLLFDEPLSNLDAKLRVHMRTEIRKIQQELGLTSIYVTHDQTEAMALSDKVIIMNKGRIEQVGTPQEIYSKPKTKFVADFIGEANFIECKIVEKDNNEYTLNINGNLEKVESSENFNIGDNVTVVVRPESIYLSEEGKYEATVLLSTFMGNIQDYILKFADIELKVVEEDPIAKKVYKIGETVKLKLEPKSMHILKK
ncbi:ABC transporter ATP-binding protein [Oceanivirga salmonicida]|uniref:ABC transporter ATP-binding protein n=1 Tax=Oceanivirga salmonicida TaxID=1769291 RepID=UPI0012E27E4E|nr:ABC transporter ATP-binding protein [Oceanivirga salmonicida]